MANRPLDYRIQIRWLLLVVCALAVSPSLDAAWPGELSQPPLCQGVASAAPKRAALQLPLPDADPGRFNPLSSTEVHHFWDRNNVLLFTGVAVVRTLDYTSTRQFRSRGHNEVLLTNSIVDNKPLFAGIELAGWASSVALSYALHRSDHHKLERWISIVHIGVGTFGDARNYRLSPLPANGAP